MLIRFRQTSESDYSFYGECFHNEEFQYMMYGNDPLKLHQLGKYIAHSDNDLKFVVSVVSHEVSNDIGFAHFYCREDGRYSYVGGLHPSYFNSGIGVLASVAAISLFFDLNPHVGLVTGIFKHNTRSLKIHLALGFVKFKETDEKDILELDKERFCTGFVKDVKSNLQYKYQP